MTTWPVLVQHWQIDCCGDRFAIGDEVAWTLALSTDDAGTWGWPEAMLIELQATGRRSALSDTGQAQMILSVDGVEVAVDGGVDRPLCGALIEQHHGGVPAGVLPVSGVVRRIRVVSQKFRSSGNRSWVPVPGVVQFS